MFNRHIFATLRIRLYLLVFLVIVPAAMLMLYTAWQQRLAAQQQAVAQAEAMVNQEIIIQQQKIDLVQQRLRNLTKAPALRQGKLPKCTDIFSDLKTEYNLLTAALPIVSNLGAIDPASGQLYCSLIPVSKVQYNDHEAYLRASRTLDFALGSYEFDTTTSAATLNFFYPALDFAGNSVQVMFFVTLDLHKFNQELNQKRVPPQATGMIIDRNGVVLIRVPDGQTWLGQPLPPPLKAKITQAEGSLETVDIDGVERLFVVAPLTNKGLYFMVGLSTDMVYGQANALLLQNIVGLGLLLVVTILAAHQITERTVLRKVDKLVIAARRLQAGQFEARTGLKPGRGELEQVAHSFDDMAVTLQQRTEALRQAHDELELRVQERTLDLQSRVKELEWLNRIAQTVSSTFDLQPMLKTIAEYLVLLFNSHSVSIALFDTAKNEMTIFANYHIDPTMPSTVGLVLPIEHNPTIDALLKDKQIITINNTQSNPDVRVAHEVFVQRRISAMMVAPLISRNEVIGAISINTNQADQQFSVAHKKLLETITGQIAGAIENARLFYEQQQANLRIQEELALAQAIQYSLLPSYRPNWPDLEVVCYTRPAKQIGGDFYNYHLFSNLGRYAFAVGDVSGKGVSAALLMATSLSQFDASLSLDLTPAARLAHLDKIISPYTKPRKQNCAMSYIEVEIQRQPAKTEHDITVTYLLHAVNAGCIPPYIKRRDGSIELLDINGFALGQGLGAELGYQQETVTLYHGDFIILTSDGVVEANNGAGEMLGFERLEELLARFSYEELSLHGAEAMLEYLNHELSAFTGQAEQHDDMTMVVVRV